MIDVSSDNASPLEFCFEAALVGDGEVVAGSRDSDEGFIPGPSSTAGDGVALLGSSTGNAC